MTRFSFLALVASGIGVMAIGCSKDTTDKGPGDGYQDFSDGDTDGDSDADTDGDTDADTDGSGGTDNGGDTDADTDSDTDGDSDADSDGDTSFDVPVDTAFDTDTNYDTDAYKSTDTYTEPTDAGPPDGGWLDASYDAGECADWELNVQVNPSRIMILQDVSSSMREGTPMKWEQAKSALLSLMGSFGFTDLLEFGLDVFPDRRDCHAEDPLVLDSAPNNGQKIFDLLTVIELSQSTPLWLAMGNFLDTSYAPIFTSREFPSYLIIVSDGKDTCANISDHFPEDDRGANGAQLGKQARLLLENMGIFTIAIGFGADADPEQLNAIAAKGGTDYDKYIQANNRDDLENIFHELAAYTINCEFDVNPIMKAKESGYRIDYSAIEFYMDGVLVPRDSGCNQGSGWDWVVQTEEEKKVVFCPTMCGAIRDKGSSSITAEFECIPYVVPI